MIKPLSKSAYGFSTLNKNRQRLLEIQANEYEY